MAETFQRPGWYPDPDGVPGERWWNGSGWSDSRRASGGAVPAPAPGVPRPPVYSADNPAPTGPGQPTVSSARRVVSSIDARANRNAMIGFITGLIALFAGVIPFLGPVAIVFSLLGIVKARQLKAQGAPSTLMPFALIGLASGAIATLIGLVGLIAILASIDVGISA